MKSNGKKLAVAWIVTIAMIVAAVFIGLRKGGDTPAPPKPQDMGLDMSLSTKQFQNHILDSAGVLSAKQRRPFVSIMPTGTSVTAALSW